MCLICASFELLCVTYGIEFGQSASDCPFWCTQKDPDKVRVLVGAQNDCGWWIHNPQLWIIQRLTAEPDEGRAFRFCGGTADNRLLQECSESVVTRELRKRFGFAIFRLMLTSFRRLQHALGQKKSVARKFEFEYRSQSPMGKTQDHGHVVMSLRGDCCCKVPCLIVQ